MTVTLLPVEPRLPAPLPGLHELASPDTTPRSLGVGFLFAGAIVWGIVFRVMLRHELRLSVAAERGSLGSRDRKFPFAW